MKRFVDAKGLAEYLSTPVSTIYYWTNTGKIKCTKIGRKLLYDLPEIEEWLKGFLKQSKNEVTK
jgi:excisionase family DNA binding protein